MAAPEKAILELPHLVSDFAGTPAAERELEERRNMLSQEVAGGESITKQYLMRHPPHSGREGSR